MGHDSGPVRRGPPPATHVLIRGSEQSPGDTVQPGFLRVLCRGEADALAQPAPPAEGTSGRRTALARWLTAPDSPASALLARVMVNRVWQQLFGRGIVATPRQLWRSRPAAHASRAARMAEPPIRRKWLARQAAGEGRS